MGKQLCALDSGVEVSREVEPRKVRVHRCVPREEALSGGFRAPSSVQAARLPRAVGGSARAEAEGTFIAPM